MKNISVQRQYYNEASPSTSLSSRKGRQSRRERERKRKKKHAVSNECRYTYCLAPWCIICHRRINLNEDDLEKSHSIAGQCIARRWVCFVSMFFFRETILNWRKPSAPVEIRTLRSLVEITLVSLTITRVPSKQFHNIT